MSRLRREFWGGTLPDMNESHDTPSTDTNAQSQAPSAEVSAAAWGRGDEAGLDQTEASALAEQVQEDDGLPGGSTGVASPSDELPSEGLTAESDLALEPPPEGSDKVSLSSGADSVDAGQGAFDGGAPPQDGFVDDGARPHDDADMPHEAAVIDGFVDDGAPPHDDADIPYEADGVDGEVGDSGWMTVDGVTDVASWVDDPQESRLIEEIGDWEDDAPVDGPEAAVSTLQQELGSQLPNDPAAELHVLSAAFSSGHALALVAGRLAPRHFYQPANELIFKAMLSMWENHDAVNESGKIKPISFDVASVCQELKSLGVAEKPKRTSKGSESLLGAEFGGGFNSRGWLERVGGPSYVAYVASGPGSEHTVERHAARVVGLAKIREIIKTTKRVATTIHEDAVDYESAIMEAQAALGQLTREVVDSRYREAGDVAKDVVAQLEARIGKEQTIQLPYPFPSLNKLTWGMQRKTMIVLAARPGVGKTAAALNIALHAAKSQVEVADGSGDRRPASVLIFSLEMGANELVQRLLAAESEIDGTKMKTGTLSRDSDVPKLHRAAAALSRLRIYIDDTPALATTEVRARAMEVHQKHGLDLIVIDYLQLMKGPKGANTASKINSRQEEVAEISRTLKGLSKSLNCPVLALAQLNREVERSKGTTKPKMSDLRESGQIEQDADIIMFLHRPQPDVKTHVELVVAKNRAGETKDIPLHFQAERTLFTERSPRYDDGAMGSSLYGIEKPPRG